MQRWWLFLSFLLAIPAAAQPSPPIFRSTSKLVQVDVVVRRKGAPAIGLTKGDFALSDNGTPQEIAFFAIRSRATGASPISDSSLTQAPALSPGTVSNHLDRDSDLPTNTTVLFLDQRNTPQSVQAFAIERIVKFVQGRTNEDRTAIYTVGRDGAVQIAQELTHAPALLRRAANGLKAQRPSFRSPDTEGLSAHAAQAVAAMDLIERSADSKQALQAIARHLASVPGRKNLIWITTAFPIMNRELGIDLRPDLEQAARSLNDANVALYAIDGRGLQGNSSALTTVPNADTAGPAQSRGLVLQQRQQLTPPDPLELATMNTLADLTGGQVYYNKSNSIEDSIRAAISDGEVTYTLGFYPAQATQDGTWHKLRVKLQRSGFDVSFRHNYFAARESDQATQRPTLEQLLMNRLDATQLELRASAAPDAKTPGHRRIQVTIDAHTLQLTQSDDSKRWTGSLDVSFYAESSGKAVTKTIQLNVPDEQLAAWLEKGIDTAESIQASGSDTLRVVVQDRTTGAAGSVTIPVFKP